MVQWEGSDSRVVAMIGRPFTPTEKACTFVERLLIAAAWCVERMSHYTMFLPELTVVLPRAAELGSVIARGLPLRWQARLVELSAHGSKFDTSDGAWVVQG